MSTAATAPRPAASHELACPHCGTPNEMPFVFCSECGAPRGKLGKYQVTFNLSLILSALFAWFYFGEILGTWPWPLYVLFSILFLQFTLALTRGRRTETSRLLFWMVLILGGFGVAFHALKEWGALFFVLAVRDIPELAQQQPRVFWPVLAAVIVLIFLPMYFRWRRLYGWSNSYRLVLLSVLSLGLLGMTVLQGLQFAYNHFDLSAMDPQLSTFLDNSKPRFDYILGMVSLSSLRIFLFEIFVFAAVKGFAAARRIEQPPMPERLKKESGLVRSSFAMAQAMRRMLQAIENMVRYLLQTLRELVLDLTQVVLAFLREFLIPLLSLVTAATLLFLLANLTVSYVYENSVQKIALLIGCIVGVILSEMIFLACKTTYRWSRITSFHGQFIGWMLPNLIVFFLLLSLSLWATSSLVNRYEAEDGHSMPFFLGLLTQVLAVVLLVMVTVVLVTKRSLLFSTASGESVIEDDEPEVLDEDAEEDELESQEAAPAAMSSADAAEAHAWDEDPPAADLPAVPHASGKLQKEPGKWDLRSQPGASRAGAPPPPEQPKGLFGAAKAALSKLPRKEASEALRGVTDKLAGKPEVVNRLQAARKRLVTKQEQLEGLENTRELVQADTYENLHRQYTRELLAFQDEVMRLTREVEQLRAEALAENHRLRTLLENLTVRQAEAQKLYEAGAIDAKVYEERAGLIRYETEKAQAQLNVIVRRLHYLGDGGGPAGTPAPAQ